MFKIRLADAIHHNHRLDNTYDGRYIVRLPDRTQVYAEDYQRRLAELERKQPAEPTPQAQPGDEQALRCCGTSGPAVEDIARVLNGSAFGIASPQLDPAYGRSTAFAITPSNRTDSRCSSSPSDCNFMASF